VPRRSRVVERGAARGRANTIKLANELRSGRVDRGLTQQAVAGAVGISRSRESYIERGLVGSVSVAKWSELLAVVGLELSVQAFPTGQPIRDAAHAALLERLHSRLHASLRWRTEIPMPILSDLRGWDAMIHGAGWRLAVEAETRPDDLQALERRIALKLRDSGIESVILLLKDSRRNRDVVRAYGDVLAERFSVPGRQALELLAAGANPGGSSLILL
jgi:transcriptional regulator with XRE-family HTH domain